MKDPSKKGFNQDPASNQDMPGAGQPGRLSSFSIGLAPLAGYSDKVYREICFDHGADFACTEMVSAKGICYDNKNTLSLLDHSPEEGPLWAQIFGHEPAYLAKAIKKSLNGVDAFTGINLNMGCPARKIVSNGDGSALMEDPILVGKILAAMVQATDKPVSVKFRLGMDDDHINYLEIGKVCQEEGAAWVALHPRTRAQAYAGQADWEAIARLKDSLSIPVIGNGDIVSPEDVLAMKEKTACDGVMIGRGALGRPFIFNQAKSYLETGSYQEESLKTIVDVLLKQYEKEKNWRGERVAIKFMRKQAAAYLAGFPGSAKFRNKIMGIDSYQGVRQALVDFLANSNEWTL